MKNKILLDIDGVLGCFYLGFSSFLNEKYNTTLDVLEEPFRYNFDEWGHGVELLDLDSASKDWVLNGGYLTMPIYSGALDFYNKLCNQYEVSLVTARVGDRERNNPILIQKIKDDTSTWLKNNKLNLINKVYFEPNKVDFCKNNDIHIMIEDKLSTAIEGSKNNLDTILIHRNWNNSPPRFRVYRSFDYNSALSTIQKLFNERS